MKRVSFILLCGALLLGVIFAPLAGAENEAESQPQRFAHIPAMKLRVLRVVDDDFTDISDADVKSILNTASYMYSDKFGAANVQFVDAGRVSIEAFFSRWLHADDDVYKGMNRRRFHVGEHNDFDAHKKTIMHFIKQWKIEELQAFFPEEERNRYGSYDAIYDGIKKQMQSKIDHIATLKVNGKPLLGKEKAAYRSFLNWIAALEQQDEFDVVLTNTFILYDDISQPSPHSIFSKCKVGGVSHANDKRTALGGRVIMGSTFGMDTDMPFFKEQDGEAPVSREERNRVTGAYIIAHELGHAIFKLPDHYSHPAQCLMNNSKTLTYAEGYRLLVKHPGRCPQCEPWLESRGRFWDGEAAFEAQDYENAITHYSAVITKTPKNVDGSYQKYMAYVSYRISKAAYKLGKMDMALKGARMAAKLFPYERRYLEWKGRIEAESQDGGGL